MRRVIPHGVWDLLRILKAERQRKPRPAAEVRKLPVQPAESLTTSRFVEAHLVSICMRTNNYIIAENAVRITVENDLPAWMSVESHYRPFAVAEIALKPALDVVITCGKIPVCDAERIYEPGAKEIGPMMASVARLSDGTIIMEFAHSSEGSPRVWVKMPAAFDKAEIIVTHENNDDDCYFLTHALMIAYMLATTGNGTLLIHSSCVTLDGRAYLFQGKSGTGKSTHARLWLENIEGADLLNDDNPVIRIGADGQPTVYGSPWSGKTPCYRNHSSPISAFVRIVRDKENELCPLAALKAYASLTASVFFMPFLNEGLREIRHQTIERLAMKVPCYEMHCRPDAEAARTCELGVRNYGQ